MNSENNIDYDTIINFMDNLKKQPQNENNNCLLKISSNNSYLKNILPLITDDSENIYTMLNFIEVNQLINNYKDTYKNIDKDKVLDLKKEAICHIKNNLCDSNKYVADLIIKAIEIKEIVNKNNIRGEV